MMPNDPPKDYITYREADGMFVKKVDFQEFKTEFGEIKVKLDMLLSNRLPKWFWFMVGVVASFIGPVVAALLVYWLK